MTSNSIIETLLNRKSIRKYTDQVPADEVVETVVRAGQQAPFAYQMGSLLLSRHRDHNPFKAPLFFIICVDSHRHEAIMAHRGWQMVQNDLSLLLLGIQDAALMAENMVIAAESVGMGSCFLGGVPYQAARYVEQFNLPPRVFPLVGLAMGYPAENPPPRPRYPLDFAMFEGQYPQFSQSQVERAATEMDRGYLSQDYYRQRKAMIRLEGERQETFTYDTYSWTEHISRKTGQWGESPDVLLNQFARCGFHIPGFDGSEQD
ncbi:MAG: nitroreductase family protein [Anaerolineales bacterium]|nr:nitroreductase family protein [Anaerolineales bacterium]